jgi:protein involved in polysaccharide export with SLBB domain
VQAGDIISIAEAKLEQAFVVGNVRAAVTINLKEPVTLSKAIALAGGTAPGAQIDKIKISRQLPNSLAKNEFIVNLKDADKRRQDDILLQPNDIVDVPGPSGTKKFLKDIFRTVVPVITRVPVVIP